MATLSTVTVPENPILAKVRRVVEKADTARSSAPLPVLRPTVLPASSSPPVPAGRQEVDLETGGILRFTDDQGTSPLSRLPDERLAAGDDWDDIARALGNAENERGGVQEVDLQPGGALTLSGPRGTQQVSRLPKERLAGTRCDDEATQVEYQSRQGISQVLGWYRIGAMLKEVRQAHSGHWTFTPSRISGAWRWQLPTAKTPWRPRVNRSFWRPVPPMGGRPYRWSWMIPMPSSHGNQSS
jgi:hypothetical protein